MESFDETENGKGEELAGSIKVCIHTCHTSPPRFMCTSIANNLSKTFGIV